jgi:translocation and assembly module TamA
VGAALVLAWFTLAAAVCRASVAVQVEGLEGPLKTNVELALSIARAPDEVGEGRLRRLHARAPDEIRKGLEPFGYYAPRITTNLEADGQNWQATYVVDPGPRTHVAAVDARVIGPGGDDPGFQAILREFPVRVGDPLDHAAYELGKRQMLGYAARKGYFDVSLDSTAILVSIESETADVVLHVSSGPRYLFGPVHIEQDVLDESMVAGYVKILPGEPYDVEPLVRMQNDLSSGPYFGAVEIHPRHEDAEDLRVPIDVVLFPSKPQRYEVGVGYGTDTGARIKLTGEWRRLNRRGHFAEAEIQASQVEYSATTKYTIPWPYPRTEVLTFFAGIGLFDPDWARSWRLACGANLGRSRGRWREVFSLAYEHESFTIADQDGSSSLVIPGVSWTQTIANDLVFATHGHRFRFDVRGSHTAALSSVSFVQLRGEAKVVRRPFARLRFLARATVARTWTDAFRELPPTVRFVTGGDQTVRGYAYESLGPVNAAGELVGGDSLVVGSAELDYRFLGSWAWAVFTDVGNALDGFSGRLSTGVGTGVRWISPIGIVRLDGAFGVSEEGNPFRIHLAIGPDL